MSLNSSVMSNSHSPSRSSGFIRRLIGCMLFVFGVAGLMAALHRYQVNLEPFWMTVFSILMIGVAVGATPRANFYAWSGFIQFLTILILLPLGLFTLGFFTNWQMGIGPLEPWLDGRIDQDQLIQLGASFLIAAITLEAWRGKSSVSISNERHPVRGGEIEAMPFVVQPSRSSRTSNGRYSSTPKIQPFLRFMKAPKSRVKNSSVRSVQPKSRFGFRQLFKHKPNIQVSLYEAHRCPYCLEEVKQNDPRGVKRCEVCNALHHADCWEVTGVCQVPHLNT
jgi:ribosomal protein L37AE/L43A